jgi:hypothetical protein
MILITLRKQAGAIAKEPRVYGPTIKWVHSIALPGRENTALLFDGIFFDWGVFPKLTTG